MYELLLVIFIMVAIGLIGLIILQQAKGASMGASFTSGASTLFGSSGSGTFMTRLTAILATMFFIISLSLDNWNSSKFVKEGREQDNKTIVAPNTSIHQHQSNTAHISTLHKNDTT